MTDTPDIGQIDLRLGEAHSARMYDYYLRGKTNFRRDRESASPDTSGGEITDATVSLWAGVGIQP